jgi:hypothetical protein
MMSDSSEYLDRTGGTFDGDSLKKKYRRRETTSKPGKALAAIEREILEEIASQSGRYGDRLAALLSEMQRLRRTIEPGMAQLRQDGVNAAASRSALNADIAHYDGLRQQALQVQHYLIIHREAMGFWSHDDVFRLYPIPAALTPLSPAHTPEPPGLP